MSEQPPKEESVDLTLSADEARAVAQVLMCVGGCPSNSTRKHTQRVLDAIRDAGLRDPAGILDFNGHSMWFEQYPKPPSKKKARREEQSDE